MAIIRKYLDDIDEIKDKINDDSDEILEVLDLNKLVEMDKQQRLEYITNVLFDYWESKEEEIKKAIKLGQKKAKDILNVIN